MSQGHFKYYFKEKFDNENFFVNKSNEKAFKYIFQKNIVNNIFLYGPKKSGKSHLASIWQDKNNAIFYQNNLINILDQKKNVIIEDILTCKFPEDLFHIINHCQLYNLQILATSSIYLVDHIFEFEDLKSRLKSFNFIEIFEPDEEMCKMLMTKLFYEKQIIIKNKEIFDFIFNRVDRTYFDIFSIVKEIDSLSLKKKRQLTIPLIKEIL